jgi:hypothetical protein
MNFDEMKEFYDFEQKIMTNTYNNKEFEKFGLLNSEWIEKYKNKYNYNLYLQNGQIKNNCTENIFKIVDLTPKFEELELGDDQEKIRIKYPNNFVLVSKKFIDLITKNFENEDERNRLLNLCYEAFKINNDLIIKDMEKNIILIYIPFSENNIFKNKYILKYSKQVYMEKELKIILHAGFKYYKNIRKISSSSFKQ